MTSTMTQTLHTVQKAGWTAEGVPRERGEVIDTSTWLRQANVAPLVNSRYLVPTDHTVTPVVCECGRLWESPEASELHRCEGRVPEAAKPRKPAAKATKTPGRARKSTSTKSRARAKTPRSK